MFAYLFSHRYYESCYCLESDIFMKWLRYDFEWLLRWIIEENKEGGGKTSGKWTKKARDGEHFSDGVKRA